MKKKYIIFLMLLVALPLTCFKFKDVFDIELYNLDSQKASINEIINSDYIESGKIDLSKIKLRHCSNISNKFKPAYVRQIVDIDTESLENYYRLFRQGLWKVKGSEYDIDMPLSWTKIEKLVRSKQNEAHSFNFFRPILHLFSEIEDDSLKIEILSFLKELILAYIPTNFFDNNDYRVDKVKNFAWYDMGVSLRADFLSYYLTAGICYEVLNHEDVELISRFLFDHLKYLLDEKYFVSHNNHGVFQAMGLKNMVDNAPYLKHRATAKEIAENRLSKLLEQQFKEGIHIENSPDYFYFILQILSNVMKNSDGFSKSFLKKTNRLLTNASKKISWFIKPNGYLAEIGDTVSKSKRSFSFLKEYLGDDNELFWLSSNGSEGSQPQNKVDYLLSKKAGYSIFREIHNAENPASSSWFLMSAAFHSRTHKHLDDLNILWYDYGEEILIEAGKYDYRGETRKFSELRKMGFWYSDPKRIFAESNHAHNTIEIDGKPSVRSNKYIYNSGILNAGLKNDVFFSIGEVIRPELVIHKRLVLYYPRSKVIIIDRLSSEKKHKYTQWLNFSPNFKATTYNSSKNLRLKGSNFDLEIYGAGQYSDNNFEVYRGQVEPRYIGWHSTNGNNFIPNLAISKSVESKSTEFVTVIEIVKKKSKTSKKITKSELNKVLEMIDYGDYKSIK